MRYRIGENLCVRQDISEGNPPIADRRLRITSGLMVWGALKCALVIADRRMRYRIGGNIYATLYISYVIAICDLAISLSQ